MISQREQMVQTAASMQTASPQASDVWIIVSDGDTLSENSTQKFDWHKHTQWVLPPHQKQIVTETKVLVWCLIDLVGLWPQILLSADTWTDKEDSLSCGGAE